MKGQELAKIVALKAYLLANQFGPGERVGLRSKAERGVQFFHERMAAVDLRRYIFYNLVMAECCRNSDPVAYRVAALDAGKRLQRSGLADPAAEYMCIVEATTERKTTASFGDFKASSDWSHSSRSDSSLAKSQAFRASAARAYEAVRLDEEVARKFDRFLSEVCLETIMESHGLE